MRSRSAERTRSQRSTAAMCLAANIDKLLVTKVRRTGAVQLRPFGALAILQRLLDAVIDGLEMGPVSRTRPPSHGSFHLRCSTCHAL